MGQKTKPLFAVLGVFLFLSPMVSASKILPLPSAIYGTDDRYLVRNLADQKILELSKSVAAQFNKFAIYAESDEHYLVKNRSLKEVHNLCSDQRFAEESSLSQCTGFLVGDDLLVTAGHCVKDKSDCKEVMFNFDYTQNSNDDDYFKLSKKDTYYCKEVIQSNYGTFARSDFALIKLDRVVEKRKPLKIRRTGMINSKDQLFVIGHPMGMPKMYHGQGNVRSSYGVHNFVTDLDTFSGNSGSPVFNEKTFAVEGILVKGEIDLEYNVSEGCYKNKICVGLECRGETASRTVQLPLLKIPLKKFLSNNRF